MNDLHAKKVREKKIMIDGDALQSALEMPLEIEE